MEHAKLIFKTHQQSCYICLTTLNRLSVNQFKTVPNCQTSNLVQLVLATKDNFERDFKRQKMNLIKSSESPSVSETECELKFVNIGDANKKGPQPLDQTNGNPNV